MCDGCSEGEHSEVGAKAYCHLANLGYSTQQIFQMLVGIFGQSADAVRNYLDVVRQSYSPPSYTLHSTYSDLKKVISIHFMELSDGEYPQYYAYNFCDASKLNHYKNGVVLRQKVFHKKEYQKVGIASDGSFVVI